MNAGQNLPMYELLMMIIMFGLVVWSLLASRSSSGRNVHMSAELLREKDRFACTHQPDQDGE